ncbi:MAG: hypothetical protein ACRDYA_22995 [Egibacteraceae bacterium]
MNPLRVVYVSPATDPPAFIMDQRNADLRRIFGADTEIQLVPERRRTPEELVGEVRDWTADAVVISSLAPGHRRAFMKLADELLVVHPVREEYRTRRGERDWRVVGFGVMREQGPHLLADGALALRTMAKSTSCGKVPRVECCPSRVNSSRSSREVTMRTLPTHFKSVR